MANPKTVALRGVRVHNLKSIDVAIPLYKLTVVTGLSGAGKGSLVFDTLYAEAQRRYLQSFSTYTRQFLERFDQPDADEIGDLPPAIAIRTVRHASARATVGSLTEIAADLRLLFARVGEVRCTSCGQVVTAHRIVDVVATLQSMPAGTRATIAFPASVDDRTDQADWLASLLEEGYNRIQAGGSLYRLGEQVVPKLAPTDRIWVLVDRIEIGKTTTERLAESVEAAWRRGNGQVGVLTVDEERVFDQRYYCPRCNRVYLAPEPRLFDANDPLGACPQCQGSGVVGKQAEICPTCQGRRYNEHALAVRVGDKTIVEWCSQSLDALLAFVGTLTLAGDAHSRADVLLDQIRRRLQALTSLDIGFLTLSQPAAHLSAGETKRLALANALASNLIHVLYLVDEPSAGLHSRDTQKLLDALIRLRDLGNTVVVVENDLRIIAAADHVIDLGPGAGEEGGTVTYQGPPAGLAAAPENPTSDCYCRRDFVEVPSRRRQPSRFLKLSGASANNLQNLSVDIPLGVLCVVTGVSGAGKRSLVEHTLYASLNKKKPARSLPHAQFLPSGGDRGQTLLLDQEPLPRSSRSNPATYLKIFDEIRSLFAETIDARIHNYGAGHFSFNQPGGRCDTCEGQGVLTTDMQFLADVVSTCPECHGLRYRKEILDIKVRSLSIAEVLNLTIREAFRFFRAQPKIEKKLKWLLDVGLDYLRLGQSVDTLSGAECQRLKLAGHLASSRATGCLFLLLEPAAGLHPAEVANLLECFDRLLAAGHSVIAVENNLDVIVCADYVIDLGPEGGSAGGQLVAHGTPEEVAQVAASHTGRALKAFLV